MDLLLKRSLVHINQSRARDASPTLCGAGGGWHPIPRTGGSLVFQCRADQAIVEWRVEQDDLWNSCHELPTGFFFVELRAGVFCSVIAQDRRA